MTVYVVVDTKINNAEAYEEYKINAKPIVESYGGEYLARGGETTVPENELWTPKKCRRLSRLQRICPGQGHPPQICRNNADNR